MAKIKKAFFCKNCGYESVKWLGCCTSCGEWNTFVEEIVSTSQTSVTSGSGSRLEIGVGMLAASIVNVNVADMVLSIVSVNVLVVPATIEAPPASVSVPLSLLIVISP